MWGGFGWTTAVASTPQRDAEEKQLSWGEDEADSCCFYQLDVAVAGEETKAMSCFASNDVFGPGSKEKAQGPKDGGSCVVRRPRRGKTVLPSVVFRVGRMASQPFISRSLSLKLSASVAMIIVEGKSAIKKIADRKNCSAVQPVEASLAASTVPTTSVVQPVGWRVGHGSRTRVAPSRPTTRHQSWSVKLYVSLRRAEAALAAIKTINIEAMSSFNDWHITLVVQLCYPNRQAASP